MKRLTWAALVAAGLAAGVVVTQFDANAFIYEESPGHVLIHALDEPGVARVDVGFWIASRDVGVRVQLIERSDIVAGADACLAELRALVRDGARTLVEGERPSRMAWVDVQWVDVDGVRRVLAKTHAGVVDIEKDVPACVLALAAAAEPARPAIPTPVPTPEE